MNKILLGSIILISSTISLTTTEISPTAAVTIAGGIIRANSTPVIEKYKRKDCPVCKGKGWYISGDGIEKVDCGYCEPESNESGLTEIIVD